MSSNRLMYDTCAYKTRVNESVGPLEYMLNPIRYENCNKFKMSISTLFKWVSKVKKSGIWRTNYKLVGNY